MGRILHNVITQSARISDGSSGSALLNKDLEIIGINLGSGGIAFFGDPIIHRFMAMPSDRII